MLKVRALLAALCASALVLALGTPVAATVNPKVAFYEADCQLTGTVALYAVFFADPNPTGGSTSAFHALADHRVFIIFTPGTDRHPDDECHFLWTGGYRPDVTHGMDAFDFWATVFIAPRAGPAA